MVVGAGCNRARVAVISHDGLQVGKGDLPPLLGPLAMLGLWTAMKDKFPPDPWPWEGGSGQRWLLLASGAPGG